MAKSNWPTEYVKVALNAGSIRVRVTFEKYEENGVIKDAKKEIQKILIGLKANSTSYFTTSAFKTVNVGLLNSGMEQEYVEPQKQDSTLNLTVLFGVIGACVFVGCIGCIIWYCTKKKKLQV